MQNSQNSSKKQFIVMIINSITNLILAVAKVIVGILFNSQLLIADGVHSFSDLVTDFFLMIGLYLAKQPKDDEHPFGHGNLEYASSLTVAVFIFFVVYELIKDLVVGWSTLATDVNHFVLFVSFFTFIAKLILSYYVLYQSKKLDSHTLKSSGTESLVDAYSTIVVIAGLLLTDFAIENEILWLMYAEKVATIVVILMLIKAAGQIFFNSIVGIAGARASKDVEEHFNKVIKEHIATSKYNFTLENIVVLKQGIDYGIFIKISYINEITLKDAAKEIELLREYLNTDQRIQKVSIEFYTNY